MVLPSQRPAAVFGHEPPVTAFFAIGHSPPVPHTFGAPYSRFSNRK